MSAPYCLTGSNYITDIGLGLLPVGTDFSLRAAQMPVTAGKEDRFQHGETDQRDKCYAHKKSGGLRRRIPGA
jgi:hypothetical protein